MEAMLRGDEFPPTHASAIIALRSPDPERRERSFERVVEAYYRAVYAFLRIKFRLGPDDARDAAHDFFLHASERQTFAAYEPERGRFRTFVRTCVERFVLSRIESAQRWKRGGRLRFVTFDAEEAERTLAASPGPIDPESIFEREWAREVATRAVGILQQRLEGMGKSKYFEVLRRYDLNDAECQPTYASIAAELGIKVTDVTNHLHAARRELRVVVVDLLRDLTASEEELRAEARDLLGIELETVADRHA